MKNRMGTRRLLSFLLSLCMLLAVVPVHAWAEEDCTHHTCGVDCSYREAVEGMPCTHQCGDGCKEQVISCVHIHSAEAGCIYTAAAEAVACDHVCSVESCGYVQAQEAVACTCGAEAEHTAECASVAEEGAPCDCGMPVTHAEGCEPREAVAGVPCGHTHGDCAYQEAREESWSCDHVCSADTGCVTEKCTHVCPADDCGYVAAVEGIPCDYVCQQCAEQNKPACTADETCTAEEHAENCPMAVCDGCEQLQKDCICCEYCDGIGEAHGENCPKAVCPHCGNLNEAHSETCSTRCTNAEGCIDGQHGKDCPLYLCEACEENPCICCDKCDGTTKQHAEDCETLIANISNEPQQLYAVIDGEVKTSISTQIYTALQVSFRTSENGGDISVEDKENFTYSEGISLQEQDGRLWLHTDGYAVSNGTVTYTNGDDVYTLTVTVTENDRLFAKDAAGNLFDLWDISSTPVSVHICYGTTTSYNEIPLSNLNTGGVAQLSGTEDAYTVSTTGAGEGGIYYIHNGYMEKLSVNGAGNGQEGSLTAKNSNGEEVSWPWITPGSTEKLELFFNGQKLTSTDGLSTGGVAEIQTYKEDEGLFEITATGNGMGDIYYTTNGYTFAYSITGASNGSGGQPGPGEPGPGEPGPGEPGPGGMNTGSVEAEYDGKPIRIGLGVIGNEAVDFYFMMRDSYKAGTDHPYDFSLYLLAVQYDPENSTVIGDVPKQFYSEITNVSIRVEPNKGEGSADNLQVTGPQRYDNVVEGADVWGFAAHADSCQGFDADVKVTFEYQGVTHELTVWLSFVETSDITVGELTPGDEDTPTGVPDKCLDEAWELNYVLSGNGNLMDWIQCHYPDEFNKIGSWSGIHIKLPAVTYDGVIEDKIVPYEGANVFNGVTLTGTSAGGQKTTMPGLICGDGVLGISDINFAAQSGKTMTFDGSAPFTCGILMDTGRTYASSSGWISACSFQNFDYGIYYTKHGVKPDLSGCLIRDCTYGLYIDCDGQTAVDFPLNVYGNRFVGCDEAAVVVESLPSGYSPYYLRIYNNAFLFNDTEFKIDISGTFFFKLNYYGGHSRGNGKYQGWHPGNKGDAEIRHAARLVIANKGSTKVITNPCRKAEDDITSYWFYNNHGETQNQHTAILNSEAGQTLIDGAAFDQNSSESQIAILDENQNEMAVWTFDGEEATE